MTIVRVDADAVAWRCSASCEPNKTRLERAPLDEAIWRTNNLVGRILLESTADEPRLYLSGSDNFRYNIYKDYKAHRRNLPRPEWLDPCREFLVREWGAEICIGYEADDGIGINFNQERDILAAYDKDFNQIPGWHFNFVTQTFFEVDSREAALSFWCSLLQGDVSDNIFGIRGMGKVKSNQALSSSTVEEMESIVRSYYTGQDFEFLRNYHLLRILRSEDEYRDIIKTINEGIFEEEQSPTASEANGVSDPGELSRTNT